MDTGKYGFVKMQYDEEEREFINISTFINGTVYLRPCGKTG